MIYYKAKVIWSEEGMQVAFKHLHQIHETECYSYCVDKWNYPIPAPLKLAGESDLKFCKRTGRKIYKIHKKSSRIAFDTKQAAFDQLLFLKKRQIGHMRREIDLLTYFIGRVKDCGLSGLDEDKTEYQDETIHTLPESSEKLREWYSFN